MHDNTFFEIYKNIINLKHFYMRATLFASFVRTDVRSLLLSKVHHLLLFNQEEFFDELSLR